MQLHSASLVRCAACAAVSLFAVVSAKGSLVIENTDIVDGSYAYSLSYDDMLDSLSLSGDGTVARTITSGGKFFNDAHLLSSNIAMRGESNGTRFTNVFLYATGGTATSQIVYRFDFAPAGFQVDSFSFKDVIFSTNANSYWKDMKSLTTQYSVDGVNWIDIRSTANMTSSTFSSGETSITLVESTTEVYYRVLFESLNGTTGLGTEQSWNRLSAAAGGSNTNFFSATFNVSPIPEPSSFALGGALAVFAGTLLLRRRHSRRRSA